MHLKLQSKKITLSFFEDFFKLILKEFFDKTSLRQQ